MNPASFDKGFDEMIQRIFGKAETRKNSGAVPFHADWQATLEATLFLARRGLREKPGCLVPLQLNDDKEWEIYWALQEKLDLPPDTYCVMTTPSFSEYLLELLDNHASGAHGIEPGVRSGGVFSVIISDCHEHERIMQVSLQSASGNPGIDVYENGNVLADYSYETGEECMNDLSRVPWIFFGPKGGWTEEQVIQYVSVP